MEKENLDWVKKLKVGDTLIAIDECVMEGGGAKTLTIGKGYRIIEIEKSTNRISILDDFSDAHCFSLKTLHYFFNLKKTQPVVRESDLIGDIEGFPIEIVQEMCEYQVAQGNKFDVTVFQKSRCTDCEWGGFNWYSISDGDSFWNNVIFKKDFDLFFEKYPKENNNTTKVDNIVQIVKEKYEGRSQIGIKKYNTTLEENKGGIKEFLVHLQEELMDATLYIQKLLNQVDGLNSVINGYNIRDTK